LFLFQCTANSRCQAGRDERYGLFYLLNELVYGWGWRSRSRTQQNLCSFLAAVADLPSAQLPVHFRSLRKVAGHQPGAGLEPWKLRIPLRM